jgi:hypothetical protein
VKNYVGKSITSGQEPITLAGKSLQVARDFILEQLAQEVGLNTHSQIPVNA